jgi:predicted RNA-binding Zn ribbon-like protein
VNILNPELLKVGRKPAPDQLIVVQGFVNTVDLESGTDEIGDRQSLKAWLIRHGLLKPGTVVSKSDLETAHRLREALRLLLEANNGGQIDQSMLSQLNRLISQYALTVTFECDGSFIVTPSGAGVKRILGEMVASVVQGTIDGTWYRLKACMEPNCRWAFYDGSKNHSGRWCSMSICGSRDKARAYRSRLSEKRRR